MTENLKVELPNFEGPLDLLLHLIRSQKIDIYDIPIAQITQQYLDYLQKMKELNLKLAGEYFVMASTLLRIKSQYLLPKNDFVPVEEVAEDPRQELVDQLVQYSVFKKVSAYFKERNDQVPITLAKEPSVANDKKVSPLPYGEISATELANTFSLLIRRFKLRRPQAATVNVKYSTVKEMTSFLENKFTAQKQVSFFECMKEIKLLDDVISLFLAVLELAKNKKLKVRQGRSFGDLELERVD
ncbi:segregation and condensation protein A [Lactobacillus psittaci]|uniref:Segregation and condensation protein A n=1 Tax=Lactobacillus psittaci DSM 15354 TaxID=1122152 RepID=A0A0R1SBZ1_9LACO|nr:segregation/condensation protein A [Lactobacillus psittaci]KRL63560.1 ScpA B protein [Lactobacillus psittaci DSM 15354]